MDWTSFITRDMVASAVRWVFTMFAGSEFIQQLAIDPTSWAAIVSGAVAVVTLIWGMVSGRMKSSAIEAAGGKEAVKAYMAA